MKTLIKTLIVALLGLSFVSTGFTADDEKMMKDHLMMKDGKMMVMKDGKTMMMDKEMTLKDGTKVMMDGTVMMKGGDKMMMKDDDMITMDGKMMKGGAKGHDKKTGDKK